MESGQVCLKPRLATVKTQPKITLTSPRVVLAWMLEHGLEGTVRGYGSDGRDAALFARMSVN